MRVRRTGPDGSLGVPLPDTWCRLLPSEPSAVPSAVVRPPGVPDEHAVPHVSLVRLLDDAVRDLPDAMAIVVGRTTLTYAELAESVAAVRVRSIAAGIGRGTSVRVDVDDPALRLTIWWALWSVGAVLRLERTGGSSPPSSAPSGLAVVRAAHRPRLGALGRAAGNRVARSRGARGLAPAAIAALEVDRPSGVPPALAVVPGSHDPALELAGPDGASTDVAPTVLTHRRLVAAAFQARLWVPDVRTGAERCLVDALPGSPVRLAFGALATVLSAGTLIVADGDDLARIAERAGATLAVVDATGLRRLATADHDGVPALRAVLVDAGDGAPERAVPWDVAARLARATGGARVAGLTAAAGPLPTHGHPVYGHVDPRGIGAPLTSTSSRILDADGAELPAGRSGTLEVDGPQLDGPARAMRPAIADERGAVRFVPPEGTRWT